MGSSGPFSLQLRCDSATIKTFSLQFHPGQDKNTFYSYEKVALFHRETSIKMSRDSYKSTNDSSLKQLFWLEMRRILQKT